MRTQIWKTVVLLALPAALTFTACDPTALKGEGDLITETRSATDFNGLDISTSGEIHVTQGNVFQVEVRAEENLLPYLKTEVEGNDLHIYFSRNVRDVDNLKIEITMPKIRKVQLSGSAKLYTHHAFSGTTLNLGVSGSGRLDVSDIDYEAIDVNVSGSGSVDLFGQADDLDAHISGSGEINALDCPVKTAEAHVSGSGMVQVDVAQKLVAYVSGSGHVQYEGNPVVEKHISGSGSVVKK